MSSFAIVAATAKLSPSAPVAANVAPPPSFTVFNSPSSSWAWFDGRRVFEPTIASATFSSAAPNSLKAAAAANGGGVALGPPEEGVATCVAAAEVIKLVGPCSGETTAALLPLSSL